MGRRETQPRKQADARAMAHNNRTESRERCVMVRGLVVPMLLALLSLQRGQAQIASLGQVLGGSHCDMTTLQDRVVLLQSACANTTCNVRCAAVLVPLMDECLYVFNHLYDETDGREDGEATILTDAYNHCMTIAPTDLLAALKTLHDEGHCPDADLDGVGETTVKAPDCADRMEGDRCSMTISAGIFTCEHDFCDTAFPPCMFAAQCDASCGLCDGAHGHRRQLQIGQHMVCDPSTFGAQVDAVDRACCDDGLANCEAGVPTACDAKCAVTFNGFYERCQRFMAAQFTPQEMADFDQLYTTCSRGLPTEPLLRAAIVCSTAPAPAPCGCSDHGTCTGSSEQQCECTDDFQGQRCSALLPAGAATGEWATLAPMPTARGYLGLTSSDGIVYAVGGLDSGSGYVATAEAYDTATREWATLAPMPTARYALGLTSSDGIVYAVGGEDSGSNLATAEAYDTATGEWATLAPMPTARSYLGLTSSDGIVYAVGGSDGSNRLATAEAYDTATGEWATLAPMPTARYALGLTSSDGIVYAVGGLDSGYVATATAEAYDTATGEWATLAPMPTARYGLGLTSSDGIVYVVGGCGSGGYLATAEAYDTATGEWATLAPMPTARRYLGLTSSDGIVYAVGGEDSGSNLAAYVI
eukprot:SAG22_NODE_1033_length_5921_cov_9.527482_5_plen_644_part_00